MPVSMLPQRVIDDGRMSELNALIAIEDIAPPPPRGIRVQQPYGRFKVETILDLLRMAYARPCFICGVSGPCGHREPHVELAMVAAEFRSGK